MADYYTQFSVELPMSEPEQVNAVRKLLCDWESGDLPEVESEWRSFQLEFEERDNGTIAWIHDDAGDGSPNEVILFVQLLAERSPCEGRWGFSWAFTCSKPRVDSFGGGAAVVDRKTGECWTTDAAEWMTRTLDGPMLPGEPLRPPASQRALHASAN
jgi:hypothetical protein